MVKEAPSLYNGAFTINLAHDSLYPMTTQQTPHLSLVLDALDSLKAKNVTQLDVAEITSIADHMVIASGTSNRHLKAMADEIVEQVKAGGELPTGVEGKQDGDWVLVDLGDVLVHLMLPEVRAHYDLERLWQISPQGDRSTDDENS